MPKTKKFDKITQVTTIYIGVSPSGKATDSDSVIRWFESSYPSQFMHDFVNKQHKIVHIFYFYTLSHRPILAENRRLGRNWGVKGEQKTPPIGYKA